MKNHGIKLLNILLSITLIFFVIALVILLNEPSVQPTSVLYMVCLYAQLIVGAFAIYWSLSKTKNYLLMIAQTVLMMIFNKLKKGVYFPLLYLLIFNKTN